MIKEIGANPPLRIYYNINNFVYIKHSNILIMNLDEYVFCFYTTKNILLEIVGMKKTCTFKFNCILGSSLDGFENCHL